MSQSGNSEEAVGLSDLKVLAEFGKQFVRSHVDIS